jgi:hypothetical protein
MNDFLLIACGAGLHDGLNPCVFMTCAVFIIFRAWAAAGSVRVAWGSFVFVFFYVLSSLFFNFGHGQVFVDQQHFIAAAKIVYGGLSVLTVILGIVFFKDWLLLSRGLPSRDVVNTWIKPFALKGFIFYCLTVTLAIVTASLASLCPINNYVTLLAGVAIIKGQWQIAVPILSVYTMTSMVALWFVWALISIKDLRPSLLKIIYTVVFLTASTCAILIFK